jgi:hypothetical protein
MPAFITYVNLPELFVRHCVRVLRCDTDKKCIYTHLGSSLAEFLLREGGQCRAVHVEALQRHRWQLQLSPSPLHPGGNIRRTPASRFCN